MRENFINRKLATQMLPWSLPFAMRTIDEIAGALTCDRKLTLDVLQGPFCA